jgi:hypothetical protein
MLHSTWMLNHCRVLATDGWAGSVDQFLFDEHTWQIRQLAIRSGGWVTYSTAQVPPSAISWLSTRTRQIAVAHTCQWIARYGHVSLGSLEDSSSEREQHDPPAPIPYCGESGLWASHIYAMMLLETTPEWSMPPGRDRHIHGTRDVTGYTIAARDRVFGYLEGFLIDDHTWRIVAARINLGPWRFGRCVDLAPHYIRSFDHSSAMVTVDLWHDHLMQFPTALPLTI